MAITHKLPHARTFLVQRAGLQPQQLFFQGLHVCPQSGNIFFRCHAGVFQGGQLLQKGINLVLNLARQPLCLHYIVIHIGERIANSYQAQLPFPDFLFEQIDLGHKVGAGVVIGNGAGVVQDQKDKNHGAKSTEHHVQKGQTDGIKLATLGLCIASHHSP